MIARLLLIVLLALASAWATPARAQASADPGSTTILQRMQRFNDTVTAKVRFVVADARYTRATSSLFILFALMLLIGVLMRTGFNGWMTNMPFVIERMTLLIITASLLTSFTTWTQFVDLLFRGFGEIIQTAMTGDSDPFAPAFRLMRAAESIQFDTGYIGLDIGAHAFVMLAVGTTLISLIALCVVSAGASMWAFWGYTLLKIIGPIFVPFLLFDRLSHWFDNWFNLFAGFLVYGLLIGVAINLAAFAFYIGLGFSDTLTPPGTAPLVINDPWEILPMIVFTLLSLWGIVRCGALAAGITGGGGGVSSQLRGFATYVAGKFA